LVTKGTKFSEEWKRNLSIAHHGQIPWIKGKKHTDISRKKMSIANTGRVPWNKGKTGVFSKETIRKMSQSHLEKKRALQTKKMNAMAASSSRACSPSLKVSAEQYASFF